VTGVEGAIVVIIAHHQLSFAALRGAAIVDGANLVVIARQPQSGSLVKKALRGFFIARIHGALVLVIAGAADALIIRTHSPALNSIAEESTVFEHAGTSNAILGPVALATTALTTISSTLHFIAVRGADTLEGLTDIGRFGPITGGAIVGNGPRRYLAEPGLVFAFFAAMEKTIANLAIIQGIAVRVLLTQTVLETDLVEGF